MRHDQLKPLKVMRMENKTMFHSTTCTSSSHQTHMLQSAKILLAWWLSGKDFACNAGDLQEMQVSSLGREDPLEKEMTTHSIILAWVIPWTEEPGFLQSTGSQRVRHDWASKQQQQQIKDTTQEHPDGSDEQSGVWGWSVELPRRSSGTPPFQHLTVFTWEG